MAYWYTQSKHFSGLAKSDECFKTTVQQHLIMNNGWRTKISNKTISYYLSNYKLRVVTGLPTEVNKSFSKTIFNCLSRKLTRSNTHLVQTRNGLRF